MPLQQGNLEVDQNSKSSWVICTKMMMGRRKSFFCLLQCLCILVLLFLFNSWGIHCILRAELLVTRYLQGAAVGPDVQLNRAEWWPSVVIEVHLLITLTSHVTLTLLLWESALVWRCLGLTLFHCLILFCFCGYGWAIDICLDSQSGWGGLVELHQHRCPC